MRDEVLLLHIRDAAKAVIRHAGQKRSVFMHSQLRQDATVRQIGIIGEAVKHLSPVTTQRAPEIPWRDIAGMRDLVIHEYFGVSPDIVWSTAPKSIPDLLETVEDLLADGGGEGSVKEAYDSFPATGCIQPSTNSTGRMKSWTGRLQVTFVTSGSSRREDRMKNDDDLHQRAIAAWNRLHSTMGEVFDLPSRFGMQVALEMQEWPQSPDREKVERFIQWAEATVKDLK